MTSIWFCEPQPYELHPQHSFTSNQSTNQLLRSQFCQILRHRQDLSLHSDVLFYGHVVLAVFTVLQKHTTCFLFRSIQNTKKWNWSPFKRLPFVYHKPLEQTNAAHVFLQNDLFIFPLINAARIPVVSTHTIYQRLKVSMWWVHRAKSLFQIKGLGEIKQE